MWSGPSLSHGSPLVGQVGPPERGLLRTVGVVTSLDASQLSVFGWRPSGPGADRRPQGQHGSPWSQAWPT